MQCDKWLWIVFNDKNRIPVPDKSAEHKFGIGKIIGVLATKVFQNGIDLSESGFKENLKKTKELIKQRKILFEPSFLKVNLYSRADIMVPVGKNEWDIIEVKSSTKVKDINIHDVSFQKYVYEKSGLKIRKCILMYINNKYVKSGEIEPKELFVQTDITEKVLEFSVDIEKRIENMFKIVEGSEPEFSVDDLLTIEYDNICTDEFMNNLPKDNVFEMYFMLKKKRVELYNSGFIKMTDIPDNIKLSDRQKIQRRLAFDGGKHIDKLGLKNFLNNLAYPIYYLDFETINPAIPKFDGMKPYQRIPFQFSLHIQEKPNGKLKHISFLAEGISDPRPKFMQALKDNLKEKVSILVYNQSFEKGVLRECSDALPEFKEWYEENILLRIKDLWDVFKNFYYYDSKQKGSTSIKYVLPLLSNLKYGDLDISDGVGAGLEYERITYGQVEESERLKVREALEKYCELDTLAEVEIVGGLKGVL